MTNNLGDLSSIDEYRVHLEFGAPLEPRLLSQGMSLVSLRTELEMSSRLKNGIEIHSRSGRAPFASPLYWWESYCAGLATCEYIGQAMALSVPARCGRHNKITALLADYVNEPGTRVMFRLCQIFDISYAGRCVAIRHLPPEQAGKVLSDVEARLIHKHQPVRNERYKVSAKTPWKKFEIELSLAA